MSEPHEVDSDRPDVADVPEPDQEPHEPTEDDETAEETETTEETGDETEPTEPEQPTGAADDAGVEKAFNALQKEAERHANRIGAIMGEDAQMLLTCPRCVTTDKQRPATPGFIWPHEVVPLLPADKAAVKLSIGEGAEPEYKTADDAYRCAKCDGFGKYKTGSQVNAQQFIQCDTCSGRGWIGQRSLSAAPAAQNGPPALTPVVVGADEPEPETDPWGRLRDDPNYFRLPGHER